MLSPAPTHPTIEILSADEVAAWLKVDRKSIYNAAARGQIPHQRLGKRLLFNRAALVAWLHHARGAR
jgi:excisionase family DNA binding protein